MPTKISPIKDRGNLKFKQKNKASKRIKTKEY
jgi:hypothetical protein